VISVSTTRGRPVDARRDGQLVAVDAGTIDSAPFLNTASFGSYDDGFFDVRFVDDSGRGSRIRLLAALTTGRLARSKVYTRTRSLEVHSLDGPLRLARDGETFDWGSDVRVAKHPERLRVYAPSPVSS
jgi:diacylglycerol kinase family enzyme